MNPTANAWLLAVAVLVALALAALAFYALFIWLVFRKGKPLWAFLRSVARSTAQAIRENPDVIRLAAGHPALSGFIKGRFVRGEFRGWPTTLLAVAFLYVLLLFLGSVEDFLTTDTIMAVDSRLANILYLFRSSRLSTLFLWVTLLGKWQMVAAAATAVSGLLFLSGRTAYIVGLWVSVAGSTLFAALGKIAFHRPRPAVALYFEHSWSFPSGHATAIMALYGFILYLLWRLGRKWRRNILASAILLTLITAVGFSRLYLGVHYLSDIWSGYLLGLLWVITGVSFAEALASRQIAVSTSPQQSKPLSRIVIAVVAAATVLLYFVLGLNYNPPRIQPEPVPSRVWAGDILTLFGEKGLSQYSETILGKPQEPMSFIISARDGGHLKAAFSSAGWFPAARSDMNSLILAGRAALFNLSDPTAPMTPSLWDGKPHDYGFQKPVPDSGLRKRHHARFWTTPYVTPDGRRIFLGTASLDTGMKWLITHEIAPGIDTEREFLFQDLMSSGSVQDWRKTGFVGPTLGKNFSGSPFFTDGQIYILKLF